MGRPHQATRPCSGRKQAASHPQQAWSCRCRWDPPPASSSPGSERETHALEHMTIAAPNVDLLDRETLGRAVHEAAMVTKSMSCGYQFMRDACLALVVRPRRPRRVQHGAEPGQGAAGRQIQEPHAQPLASNFDLAGGDGQAKAARARAAGIHEERAVPRLDAAACANGREMITREPAGAGRSASSAWS